MRILRTWVYFTELKKLVFGFPGLLVIIGGERYIIK